MMGKIEENIIRTLNKNKESHCTVCLPLVYSFHGTVLGRKFKLVTVACSDKFTDLIRNHNVKYNFNRDVLFKEVSKQNKFENCETGNKIFNGQLF